MNKLAIGGVVVNCIMALVLSQNEEWSAGLKMIPAVFAFISVIGAVLSSLGTKKPGAILIIVGSIMFVPIGLIGVFGGKKQLDELKREAFERQGQQPQPSSMPRSATITEQQGSPWIIWTILAGAGLHLLVSGYVYASNIFALLSGAFPLEASGSFLTALASYLTAIAGSIVGVVMIRRGKTRAGGVLVIAVNAMHIVGRLLFLINRNVPVELYIQSDFLHAGIPSLISLGGGLAAVRVKADQKK